MRLLREEVMAPVADPLRIFPGEREILEAYDRAKKARFEHGMFEIAETISRHIERVCAEAEALGFNVPEGIKQALRTQAGTMLTDCLERKVSPFAIVLDLRKLIAKMLDKPH